MAVRLTRTERKEQTRGEIVAAARAVFLRRGFHAASLDEIAEEAGYTKGAVYSSFAGKDDLFLAVLADYYDRQVDAYADVLRRAASPEESFRSSARLFVEGTQKRDPTWTPLVTEFMTHASRREPVRQAVAGLRESFLDAIGDTIAEFADRHGLEFRLPPREVARGSGAVMRGLAVERLVDPDAVSTELVEEIHAAYMRGVTR